MQVNHPHCVQIFSASLKAADPFIVMEWMAGGSWFDALGEDPPPPAYQRIRAARETASALAYLHHPLIGIIHGDIKGLNVLRARDGSSKVPTAAPAGVPARQSSARNSERSRLPAPRADSNRARRHQGLERAARA